MIEISEREDRTSIRWSDEAKNKLKSSALPRFQSICKSRVPDIPETQNTRYFTEVVAAYIDQQREQPLLAGWICTRRVEYDAVMKILEERQATIHSRSIGKRLVMECQVNDCDLVITYQVDGIAGTAAAATSTDLLKVKYPSLQCLLLVGLAGGLPRAGVRVRDIPKSRTEHGGAQVVELEHCIKPIPERVASVLDRFKPPLRSKSLVLPIHGKNGPLTLCINRRTDT